MGRSPWPSGEKGSKIAYFCTARAQRTVRPLIDIHKNFFEQLPCVFFPCSPLVRPSVWPRRASGSGRTAALWCVTLVSEAPICIHTL